MRFRCLSMEARPNPRLCFPPIRADAPPKGARLLNPTRDSRSLAHKPAEPCARPSGPCAQASEPCGRGCTALRPSLPIPARGSPSLAHKPPEPCAQHSEPCAQVSEPCGRGCTALRPGLPIPAHGSPSLAHKPPEPCAQHSEPCAQALEPRDRGCNARKAGKSPRHARHQLVKRLRGRRQLNDLTASVPFLLSCIRRVGNAEGHSPRGTGP